VTDESPLGQLIRRYVSPVHWHTITAPDSTPTDPPRNTIAALHALRHAAATPATSALAVLVGARRRPTGPLGSLPDLEADLDHPHSDRNAIRARLQQQNRRDTARAEAVNLTRRPDGLPPAFPPQQQAWNWVLSHLPHGLCLSFAEGLTPADLLARLTGDLSQAITPTDRWLPPAHERTTEENPIPYAGVARTGVWALAIEPTSSVAAQPDMPATISTGTRALCLRHDRQTGVTRFCYAEDGVLVTEFDPLFPDNTIGADARASSPG
jgi:hypothetical protein